MKALPVIILYVSSLLATLIISLSAIFISIFGLAVDWIYNPIVFLILLSLGILSYFSFSYFNFQKGTIAIVTLTITLITSTSAFFWHAFIEKIVHSILSNPEPIGILYNFIHQPINIVTLTLLLLIAYNILPIYYLIKNK